MKKYNYLWTLKDANFSKNKGTVFSCFSCGGGSTMGYKLAGFDVVGCNEIDPRMMAIYTANNSPKYSYLEDIRDFVQRSDFPCELYNLDILDGSPPCSTFSMSGDREKTWGIEKKFAEGQKKQVLDTLFFDFIELAKKLKPKIVVAENVKGIILGDAKKYVSRIYSDFEKAGYIITHKLLNGANMGLPQRRERVFFIAVRKDIATKINTVDNLFYSEPKIDLSFNEPHVTFSEIKDEKGKQITPTFLELWKNRQYGDNNFEDIYKRLNRGKYGYFDFSFLYDTKVVPTINSQCRHIYFNKPLQISDTEIIKASSFPLDFNFCGKPVSYVCGMSVPPLMVANIADAIFEQMLSKL